MTAGRPCLAAAALLAAVLACDRRELAQERVCPPCECACNQAAPGDASTTTPVAASSVAPPTTPSAPSSAAPTTTPVATSAASTTPVATSAAWSTTPVATSAASTTPVAPSSAAPPIAAPPVAPALPGPLVTTAADAAELASTAARKMMHGDGAGCLADLDRLAALDPRLGDRLAATRGQCEMLVGRCQAGKARVARWYVDETAMTRGRADLTAESLAAMRCRDGDSTDRDRLLRAFHELSDGAYVNERPPALCREQLAVARRLIPTVKPAGPDDTAIAGGAQALFHTAAACFARAGDCAAAWSTYRALFPGRGLDAVPAAERDQVVAASFDSSLPRCAGKR